MDDSGESGIPPRHVAELSAFFAAHDRWLFGHACVRTRGDRELAADLVQDTFEAAARAWASLREYHWGRQRAWLLGTLADLFVADFHPQPDEHLAGQQAAGYDAGPGRARFQAWLGEHAETAGADPVQDYLKQVSRVPGLTAAEEAELAKRIEAGLSAEAKLAAGGDRLPAAERIDLEWAAEVGSRARYHLLEANLRLVVTVAKRFTGRGLSFLDLIQEGNLGLIRAVEKFDYTKGYAFSTYATWWVRQAITRALATAAKRPEAGDAPPQAGDAPPETGDTPAGPQG